MDSTATPTSRHASRPFAAVPIGALAAALLLAVLALAGTFRVEESGAVPNFVVRDGVAMATGDDCQAVSRGGFVGVGGGDSFGDRPNAECILGLQAASGVGVLRHTFDWGQIEYAPGAYDFSLEDWWVAATARKRMRVLPILFGAPPFHSRRSSSGTYPPRDNSAFARFAAAVVRRYGRGGSFWAEHPELPRRPIVAWQLWNEPNLRQYWLPRPNPAAYVRLLKAGSAAIKAVDPRAQIVTAGLPNSLQRTAIRYRQFVKAMYLAGAKRAFDVLAPNAYASSAAGVIKLMRQSRALMNRFRDRRARLWLTEVGWGTAGPASRFNIGQRGQAREVGRLFRGLHRLRRKLRLEGVVYFGWRDKPPYPPAFKDMWGLHTGLFTLAGAAKPGYRVFARLAPGLR